MIDELAERRKEKQIIADIEACIEALNNAELANLDDINWEEE